MLTNCQEIMITNKHLKNLNAYEVKIIPSHIKRLHANESSKPILPIKILQKDVFKNLNYYPENQLLELDSWAENFYKIDQKYITHSNGSDEGLDLIIRSCCNKNDKCVVLNPTFSMYQLFANASGLKVLEFDLDQEDFSLNIKKFIEFCQKIKPKIIFIPNPIAPTANKVEKNDLIELIKTLKNSFVVIDEAYIEFSNQESLINLVPKYKNLIVTRTLSKFFGLAAVRVGFVFSQYKNEILKIKTPYNVNAISAKIAINLFQNINQKIIKARQKENNENKKALINKLKKFQELDKIYDSHTNFIFFKLKNNAKSFAKKFLQQKIKIKIFTGKFEKFCRITVE
mgnify:CR=1 FL=1